MSCFFVVKNSAVSSDVRNFELAVILQPDIIISDDGTEEVYGLKDLSTKPVATSSVGSLVVSAIIIEAPGLYM